MGKQVLWISGTSVIRGAEYVFGDYLKQTKFSKDITLLMLR